MKQTKNVPQAIDRLAPLVPSLSITPHPTIRGRYLIDFHDGLGPSSKVGLHALATLADAARNHGTDEAPAAVRWYGPIPIKKVAGWHESALLWLQGWQA